MSKENKPSSEDGNLKGEKIDFKSDAWWRKNTKEVIAASGVGIAAAVFGDYIPNGTIRGVVEILGNIEFASLVIPLAIAWRKKAEKATYEVTTKLLLGEADTDRYPSDEISPLDAYSQDRGFETWDDLSTNELNSQKDNQSNLDSKTDTEQSWFLPRINKSQLIDVDRILTDPFDTSALLEDQKEKTDKDAFLKRSINLFSEAFIATSPETNIQEFTRGAYIMRHVLTASAGELPEIGIKTAEFLLHQLTVDSHLYLPRKYKRENPDLMKWVSGKKGKTGQTQSRQMGMMLMYVAARKSMDNNPASNQ